MNAASTDIKDYLIEIPLLQLTFGTNLFIAKQPDSPDQCTTLFDVPGEPDEILCSGTYNYEYPKLIVRVRSHSYQDAYSLIQDIKDTLHGLNGETINGTKYLLVQTEIPPYNSGWDENNRVELEASFAIQRSYS